MARSAGTRLGPYEILEPLGAGGMGEVYRARDPRLKRDVALKVLPPELASEPERLERFQREAETLAALNHPHIVTIFSVEEADDLHFLTMELVQGKTLTKVIPRDGLPLSRFFQIAIPLAEAVSAAHEKGIIHRDLKPGNVMVTEEGRVKVLDFGLAKLREGVRGEVDTQSPTEPATGPGRVMGTAPYMSPEQVQGRALDHRSDVFALGIMLYEMATGERPFAGDTFADVASSILKDDPVSVTEQKADLPRDLAKLIRHCLEKEPRRRFQSSLDLANELEELRREVDTGEALTGAGAPITEKRPGATRRVWLVGGSAIAALALGVGYLLSSRAPEGPAEPVRVALLTSDGGEKRWPQLSPDGEKVAYVWQDPADEKWHLYVKAMGVGSKPLRVTEDFSWSPPVWSPDGRQIALVDWLRGGIYTVPSLGGQARKMIDINGPSWAGAHDLLRLSWSPDGDWLALAERASADGPVRIIRLSLDTLEKQPLTSPPENTLGDFCPAYSPDGTRLAFVRSGSRTWGGRDVWVQPVAGREARRLTFGDYTWCEGLAWTADGEEILFAVQAAAWNILRVRLKGGEPQPVPGVGQDATWPSVRGDRMVYAQLDPEPVDIWRVPGRRASLPERPPERLIASPATDDNPAYSPDGRRIAFSSRRSGAENIWVCDSDGSHPVQLTSLEPSAGSAGWSPDGRRIVFDSPEAGDWNLYVIDAEGGAPRRLTQVPADDNFPAYAHDGRWIYFNSNRSGRQEIWKIPPEGGEAIQVTQGGGMCAEESWDGRFLYYGKGSPDPGIWRVPVEGGDEAEVVRENLAHPCGWALSESGIYYGTIRGLRMQVQDYTIQYLDLESGQVTELYRKEGPFEHTWLAVSPDEEWILVAQSPPLQSELMLVENFR